jgi:hypothetical protein
MAGKPLDRDGQNWITKGKTHGESEQADASSPLRRALLRSINGEPGIEPIQPSAHHRTITFRWAIVAQLFKPICAVGWACRSVAKCRNAYKDAKSHERRPAEPTLVQSPFHKSFNQFNVAPWAQNFLFRISMGWGTSRRLAYLRRSRRLDMG